MMEMAHIGAKADSFPATYQPQISRMFFFLAWRVVPKPMLTHPAAAAAGPPWLGWPAGLLPAAHLRLTTALLAARPGRFERHRGQPVGRGGGGVLHELQVERGARTGVAVWSWRGALHKPRSKRGRAKLPPVPTPGRLIWALFRPVGFGPSPDSQVRLVESSKTSNSSRASLLSFRSYFLFDPVGTLPVLRVAVLLVAAPVVCLC